MKGLITHPRTDVDEITAMFLLYHFGEEKFPGVKQVITEKKVFFCRESELQGSPEDYEKDGYILLGIGGGRFDEHPAENGNERKEKKTCVQLVAEYLGVDQVPELAQILRFVYFTDLKGNGHPFDIANGIKLIHGVNPGNEFAAIDWAFTMLKAKYAEQYDFHVIAKKEVEEKAATFTTETMDGRKIKIVSITTDNTVVARYIRSEFFRADVIVQQNSVGQVQIFTDKRAKLNLNDVARAIRVREQEMKGNFITTDWRQLSNEGTVPGAEEWYYFQTGAMLLNGSITAPNTPPTKLRMTDIVLLIDLALSGRFHSLRSAKCNSGICDSTRKNPCSLYDFGFDRCQQVRKNAKLMSIAQ